MKNRKSADVNNKLEKKFASPEIVLNPISLSLSQVPFWLETYRHNYIASFLLSFLMFGISSLTISKYNFLYQELKNIFKKKYFSIAGLFLVILSTISLYSLFNSGLLGPGSDGDDQYFVLLNNIFSGLPFYHGETYFGNPITPLPGLFVLVFPFAVLGYPLYSLLNIFTIQLVFSSIFKNYNLSDFLVFLILSVACFPILLQQIGSGHDYFYNYYILIISGSLILFNHLKFLMEKVDRPFSSLIFIYLLLLSLVFGFSLSGRPILSLATLVGLLSTVLIISKKPNLLIPKFTISKIILNIFLCLIIAGLISLWGFLQDPLGFDPLHLTSRLKTMNEISIYIPYLLTIISVCVPIITSKIIFNERVVNYIGLRHSWFTLPKIYNYIIPIYIWTLYLIKQFSDYNLLTFILILLMSSAFYFYAALSILRYNLIGNKIESLNINSSSVIVFSSLFSSCSLGIVFSGGLFIHWIYIYALIPIYLIGFYSINKSNK